MISFWRPAGRLKIASRNGECLVFFSLQKTGYKTSLFFWGGARKQFSLECFVFKALKDIPTKLKCHVFV